MDIKKVAVIGSGVMGRAIAAHIANANLPVILLDIVKQGEENRNFLAQSAIDKMLKDNPAPFMHKKKARNVTAGNLEDDLKSLADCDWIIEAVIENLDIKRDLYAKIESVRKEHCVVSSNTSTIPLEQLTEGRNTGFKSHFMITHFFNPPRYMRLLEIVYNNTTDKDCVKAIEAFADYQLGKTPIHCKDTAGFIANRLGIFWIQTSFNYALEMGLTVEESDAAMSKPFGIPKTGIFGLADLVGLDIMPYLSASMKKSLPAQDTYVKIHKDFPLFAQMIKDGNIGRKGKGGFYRLQEVNGKKEKQAIDLKTGTYRTAQKVAFDSIAKARSGLRTYFEAGDLASNYAQAVFLDVASYTLEIAEQIAANPVDIDQAMKLGYNWKYGPFELIDQLGASYVSEALKKEGRAVPALLAQMIAQEADQACFYKVDQKKRLYRGYDGKFHELKRASGIILLEDIRQTQEPAFKNASCKVWDIGDGVLCLEFTSKMNSIDAEILAMIRQLCQTIPQNSNYKGLVIYNEGSNFSVGANLGMALFVANIGLWPQIEQIVEEGQQTYKAMKYAPFPVVGAPSGMALGGGCEVLLHCDEVVAHSETYIGLVEAGVGLLPAWGGCKEMISRWQQNKKAPKGPMPAVMKSFEMISTAKVATSADEAFEQSLFLENKDQLMMNRDRLLYQAKQRVLERSKDYKTPEPPIMVLPGPSGKAALTMAVEQFAAIGLALPHDIVVSDRLSTVLSGGNTDHTTTVSEDEMLSLERAQFMNLIKTNKTLDRIEHMLTTGKPLRN